MPAAFVSFTMAEDAEAQSYAARRAMDDQVRASINQKLEETGMKDELKEMMRARLIEAGWRDQLKERCREIIRNKGLEKVTVEELVKEITPHGRATVPEDIKAEMLQKLRAFLEQTPNNL